MDPAASRLPDLFLSGVNFLLNVNFLLKRCLFPDVSCKYFAHAGLFANFAPQSPGHQATGGIAWFLHEVVKLH